MTREEAIKHGKEQLEVFGGEHLEFILMAIEALEQEPRAKGEWEVRETEEDIYIDIMCTACKRTFTVDADRKTDIGFTAYDFNFCPKCGADMRGDTE